MLLKAKLGISIHIRS